MKTLLEFLVNKPITTETNGLTFVDLGLPSGLLWADRNLGASSPEKPGDYYKWGETKPCTRKVPFNKHDFFNKDKCLKYGEKNEQLSSEDDIATVKNSNWHQPTLDNINELITYTDSEIKDDLLILHSQKSGNKNFIIMPLAGFMRGNTILDSHTGMGIWSSTSARGKDANSVMSDIQFKRNIYLTTCSKFFGLQVRPVKNK